MIKFTIPGTLDSLNDYTKACRGKSGAYTGSAMKRSNEKRVMAAAKRLSGAKITAYPVFIAIKWVERDMKRDKDNIAFAKKFIFDALVFAKVLAGDGWRHIDGFSDSFAVDKAFPRVEVAIYGADETAGALRELHKEL